MGLNLGARARPIRAPEPQGFGASGVPDGRKRLHPPRPRLTLTAHPLPSPGDAAMLGRKHLFAVAVLLASAAPVVAGDALELVPEEAAVAVVVRNISDFKKKGDKFFASA